MVFLGGGWKSHLLLMLKMTRGNPCYLEVSSADLSFLVDLTWPATRNNLANVNHMSHGGIVDMSRAVSR